VLCRFKIVSIETRFHGLALVDIPYSKVGHVNVRGVTQFVALIQMEWKMKNI
jgi:hypothetical protein